VVEKNFLDSFSIVPILASLPPLFLSSSLLGDVPRVLRIYALVTLLANAKEIPE